MPWQIDFRNVASSAVTLGPVKSRFDPPARIYLHVASGTLATGAQDYTALDQKWFKSIVDGGVDFYQGFWIGATAAATPAVFARLTVPIHVGGVGGDATWAYLVGNAATEPAFGDPGWITGQKTKVTVSAGPMGNITLDPLTGNEEAVLKIVIDD